MPPAIDLPESAATAASTGTTPATPPTSPFATYDTHGYFDEMVDPAGGPRPHYARFARRVPTVAVRIAGYTPRELAAYLGERGISTWDGNYYALSVTERLGVEANGGMLRIGLVHYNTAAEVQRLLEALNTLPRRAS